MNRSFLLARRISCSFLFQTQLLNMQSRLSSTAWEPRWKSLASLWAPSTTHSSAAPHLNLQEPPGLGSAPVSKILLLSLSQGQAEALRSFCVCRAPQQEVCRSLSRWGHLTDHQDSEQQEEGGAPGAVASQDGRLRPLLLPWRVLLCDGCRSEELWERLLMSTSQASAVTACSSLRTGAIHTAGRFWGHLLLKHLFCRINNNNNNINRLINK